VPERVLVLCSANRCRSPLAAALLRAELTRVPWPVVVASAGVSSFAALGLPVPEDGQHVARRRGLELANHQSATLSQAALGAADLVVAMDRSHVREAVVVDPSCWPRTFTLKELVRRARAVGPRPDGALLRTWLEEVGADRSRDGLAGRSEQDDIEDPFGRGPRAWEALADELSGLVRALVSLAWPARPGPAAGRVPGRRGSEPLDHHGGLAWW